jgi:hypothetical protein
MKCKRCDHTHFIYLLTPTVTCRSAAIISDTVRLTLKYAGSSCREQRHRSMKHGPSQQNADPLVANVRVRIGEYVPALGVVSAWRHSCLDWA